MKNGRKKLAGILLALTVFIASTSMVLFQTSETGEIVCSGLRPGWYSFWDRGFRTLLLKTL